MVREGDSFLDHENSFRGQSAAMLGSAKTVLFMRNSKQTDPRYCVGSSLPPNTANAVDCAPRAGWRMGHDLLEVVRSFRPAPEPLFRGHRFPMDEDQERHSAMLSPYI